MKPWYNLAPGVTDLPVTFLYVKAGRSISKIRITGPAVPSVPTGVEPDVVPDKVREFRELLKSLTRTDGVPWTPRYLEVILVPYEYAPDASVYWPKKWPGLQSNRTIQHGKEYSIFMDWQQKDELVAFLRARKEKGAVVIGGRKWGVYTRPVIPGEPAWLDRYEGR